MDHNFKVSTIPMSKRMFPEDIDEVNKIDGPYTSKSLETQKVLKGREDNTAVVPTLVPTHSFLHGMSNIISTPTTVGSSTARLVTVVKDQKKKSRGGYKCKCGCGGCVQGPDSYTLLCAQRLGVPHDPHGIIKKKTERRLIKRALMAEERLAAAGLSVDEDEHGDDLIQALVIVITGKMVTAFPEVY